MARDRQRAKARKQRQAPQPPSRTDEGNGVAPEPDHLHRSNVPGAWEHGGEVDQFEAELVAGADGQPADDPDAAERASLGAEAAGPDQLSDPEQPAGAADDLAHDGRTDDLGDEYHDPVDGGGTTPPPPGGAVTASGSSEPARARGGNRFLNFLRACWAELQRVQWPDRRQVGQATLVVLGFLVVAGAFLGAADFVANEIVNLII